MTEQDKLKQECSRLRQLVMLLWRRLRANERNTLPKGIREAIKQVELDLGEEK